MKNASIPHSWKDFLKHKHEQHQTATTQEDIMGLKQRGEFARLSIFHDNLYSEYDGKV
jgi:hypothetical protein